MRRRWGRGFDLSRRFPPPKSFPRRWGSRRRFPIAKSSGSGTASRKWAPKKPRRRVRRKHVWIAFLFLLLFAIVQSLVFLDRELRGPLMFLAKIRINQMATEAINTAITEEVAQGADAGKLIQWKMKSDGKVSGFLIDYREQMNVISRTVEVVERVLKEQESVPERIPIGHALNSPLLSSIGPSVSVELHPETAVKVDVGTRQKNAGINMLLVEVYVRIRTEIAVVIPFDREPEMIETEIPLSYALIVGDVPAYYYDSSGKPVGEGAAQAPAISLPSKPEGGSFNLPEAGADAGTTSAPH